MKALALRTFLLTRASLLFSHFHDFIACYFYEIAPCAEVGVHCGFSGNAWTANQAETLD